MAYWLIKSEPDSWSWAQQKKRGAKGEVWSGVRNHQAKLNLMRMALGDLCFFYHSNEGKEIVGIADVIKPAFPDPTADKGPWVAVTVKAVRDFARPVNLDTIKAEPRLKDMVVINNSRLSIQPVTQAEWSIVCSMGGVEP
jgi:predicted RNA-binding protein with PUA-like domain